MCVCTDVCDVWFSPSEVLIALCFELVVVSWLIVVVAFFHFGLSLC